MQALSPIRWLEDKQSISVIDQRLIPYSFSEIEIKTLGETVTAIKDMIVRGAPLIGITAAYGMVLAADEWLASATTSPRNDNYRHREPEGRGDPLRENLAAADKALRNSRPTAVNLMWALDQIQIVINKNLDKSPQELRAKILEKAKWIHSDDIDRCKRMGDIGAKYINQKFAPVIQSGRKLRIMTHCNAGALATGGYGTALGVIRSLHRDGLVEMVYANETRPRQQGARLTAWELSYDRIPVTLVTDNMAAHLMPEIDLVVTGADRIAANGDSANKIGTYGLAIIANYHRVPFYIAAPLSTFDFSIADGMQIPIEEREHSEVSHINERSCTISADISVQSKHQFGELQYRNPAFDVTPAELIERIFSEHGASKPKDISDQQLIY